MGEIVFLGLLFLLSGYLFYLPFYFPVNILERSGGAGLFPRIVLAFLMVFLIIRIIQILCQNEKKPFVFAEMFKGTRFFYLITLTAYVALLKVFGYFICTTLFLAIMINILYRQVLGEWGSVKIIVIRNLLIIAFAVLMNLFFSKILHVLLPVGILFQ